MVPEEEAADEEEAVVEEEAVDAEEDADLVVAVEAEEAGEEALAEDAVVEEEEAEVEEEADFKKQTLLSHPKKQPPRTKTLISFGCNIYYKTQ